MKKCKKISIFFAAVLILSTFTLTAQIKNVKADPSFAEQLAYAILENSSDLISAQYTDSDSQNRQAAILESFGHIIPDHGDNFILLSTGIAGANPVTRYELDPGSERGTWFGSQYYQPYDRATLTMQLQVPLYMHYLNYNLQFFTTEYPDYQHSGYNDKVRITVVSPSQGTTTHILDVDEHGGDFVYDSGDYPLEGTGYDVYATSGNPDGVDWLSTTPEPGGEDAGASAHTSREHPVSPNEIVTVTIDIVDDGDNQFDSSVYIDYLRFSGEARTDIVSRKEVLDLNGGEVEPGDQLEYSVTISNIGDADQADNPGFEFEDIIPENTEYVVGSADIKSSTGDPGTISFDGSKITWDGGLDAYHSVVLSFKVQLNSSLVNGTIISNQGVVNWDSNEDGSNDAVELTDDPTYDDGIDQDGDGETNDDDPTIVEVVSFEVPMSLTEDFSDDETGEKASQSFEEISWFETTTVQTQSNFEVAGDYHYSTQKSFKTKLRSTDNMQYWNYSFGLLNSELDSWEAWFACGNMSAESNLILDFKTNDGTSITTIKLDYERIDSETSSSHAVKLYYKDNSGIWKALNSNFEGGYLYNGWYKLRLKQNDTGKINFSLYQNGFGLVESIIDNTISNSLSALQRVEWSSTTNPTVCPIFFWDEHKVGLNSL